MILYRDDFFGRKLTFDMQIIFDLRLNNLLFLLYVLLHVAIASKEALIRDFHIMNHSRKSMKITMLENSLEVHSMIQTSNEPFF